MNRRAAAGRVACLALSLALVGVSVPTAQAWWQASRSATAAATAAIVAPPTGVSCQTTGNVIARTATISWVAPVPAPTSYLVTFVAGDTTTTLTTFSTQLVVSQGLLAGLLDSLLQLLLGGTVTNTSMQAVHSSGWVSTPTPALPLRGALVSGQGTTGVVCG